MATLTLDVVTRDDETLDDALAALTDGLALDASPTGYNGGGGWPEIRFTGARDALTELARRYVGEPTGPNDIDLTDEVAFHVGCIEE